MKISEVSARTGLTARTIRFYQDSGLIHPEVYVHNGRRFTEYSEADVTRLRLIARLRGAMLSIAQIRTMLDAPDQTAEVFEAYREELNAEFGRLSALIGQVNAIDAGTLNSAESLSDALGEVEGVGLPKGDTTYNFRIHRLEDDTTDDERRAAYEAWCRRQTRRDRWSWLTGWVYYVSGRTVAIALAVIIGVPTLAAMIGYNIYNLHWTEKVRFTAGGYAVSLENPETVLPVTAAIDGDVYWYSFKYDYFLGNVSFDVLEQKIAYYGRYVKPEQDFPVRVGMNIPDKDIWLAQMAMTVHTENGIEIIYDTKSGKRWRVKGLHLNETLDTLIGYGTLAGDEHFVLICPAENTEEAIERSKQIFCDFDS